jgi:hypothetical protein
VSLRTVELALVDYISQAIVDCGFPVPDRILSYHATQPIDCCSENGTLVVNWAETHWSVTFPGSGAGLASPCPGQPVATVVVRYFTCWPVPDATDAGVTQLDEEWTLASGVLADVTDCVVRAFGRAQCATAPDDDLLADLIEQTGASALSFIDAQPIRPLGGCAGVAFRAYCALRYPVAVS